MSSLEDHWTIRMNPMAKSACLAVVTALLMLGVGVASAALQPVGNPVRISNMGEDGDPSGLASSPAIAYNPVAKNYLVVWEGRDAAPDYPQEIFGQLLSTDGAEIGSDFRISGANDNGVSSRFPRQPAVAFNLQTNEYLVVWSGDELAEPNEVEIFAHRVNAAGTEEGMDFQVSNVGLPVSVGRGPGNPAIAYNSKDNEYLVSWEEPRANLDIEIRGQRLSASGTPMGTGMQISNPNHAAGSNFAFEPSIAYNSQDNEYLVGWHANGPMLSADEFEIFGQRLSAAGVEQGGDFRISTTGSDGDPDRSGSASAIAYNSKDNEYLVSWSADALATAAEYEIFGQRLSAAGVEQGGDFRISTTGSDGDVGRGAFYSTIAYDLEDNEYLVGWEADGLATDDEVEIFGQRLSAAGVEQGGDFRISTTGSDGDVGRGAHSPGIAFGPANDEYLVVWQADGLASDEEFEIFGQRLADPPQPPPPPPPPPATHAKCAGEQATKVGTPGRDVIKGTPKRDVIAALGGNDVVRSLGGNDIVCGGAGKDKLIGGKGKDLLRGDGGADTLLGGAGKDKLNGGKGRDVLKGGPGKDRLVGGPGKDKERQ